MFDKTKENSDAALGKTNRIVEGTIIKGDIASKTDFRLDGELIGNFKSNSKLVIGANAVVIGDVEAGNLDIEGKFEGKLNVTGLLSLKSKSTVKGEMVIGKLSVEPGAEITATCAMQTGKSIAMNPVEKNAKKA